MKKKELDNLILNEIFGLSKDPSKWKDKDFERYENNIFKRFGDVKVSFKNPGDPEKRQDNLGSLLRSLRQGTLGMKDFPRNFWEEIYFTDETIDKISTQLGDRNFKKILDQYTQRFTGEDTTAFSGIVKPKKIGAEEEDDLPVKKDTEGDDPDLPMRARKKGELKPVSGELKPVSGEVRPVKSDIEEVPEKKKQKGTSLRLDPKRLSDERYVKEFAKLVADYVMLSPQSKVERERQSSKILDLKKQMNDLMKQRTPGAIDLQRAIRDEIAPLQRRMQQIAESFVKENFEQTIREELENYIKEKK